MIYTVIGLIDNTRCPPELTVAGVIAGEVSAVDHQPDWPDSAQRWADYFDATDSDDAEAQAHRSMQASS